MTPSPFPKYIRVLLRSRHAYREEQPIAFWTTVVVLRFGIAAVMVGAGVFWLLSLRA